MRFTTTLNLFAALVSIPFICAEPTHVRLFHRLYHPTVEELPFSERGSVLISENNVVSFHPSSSYARDLNSFAEALRTVPDSADLALYQVSVGQKGDVKETQWDVSSVKVVSVTSVKPVNVKSST
jgi:ER membrane protein complex subunit 10